MTVKSHYTDLYTKYQTSIKFWLITPEKEEEEEEIEPDFDSDKNKNDTNADGTD